MFMRFVQNFCDLQEIQTSVMTIVIYQIMVNEQEKNLETTHGQSMQNSECLFKLNDTDEGIT